MTFEAEVAFWTETLAWLKRHPELPTQRAKVREAKRALSRARGELR
jgi:hypothetical protein